MKIQVFILIAFGLLLSCGKKASTSSEPEDTISITESETDAKSQPVDSDPLATLDEIEPAQQGSDDQEVESDTSEPEAPVDLSVVQGCMDPLAFNYDNLATEDDGSCEPVVMGCLDELMFNYNASANVDDGSCVAIAMGCTDSDAFNFNPSANTEDGSCIAKVMGCMDSAYLEYDSNANTDDGSCLTAIAYGCTDNAAANYDPLANTDDGSCNAVAMDPEQSLPINDIGGTGSDLSLAQGDVTSNPGVDGVLGGQATLGFDGDDMLAISNGSSFNTTGPFYGKTVTMVFRTGSDITNTQILFEQGGGTRGLNIHVSNSKIYFNIWNNASDGGNPAWGPIFVEEDIAADTDYVATLYYDQTQGVIRGYLNGSLAGESFGCGLLYSHSGGIGIGAINGKTMLTDGSVPNGGGHFTGLIANFVYYDEAISDSQLSDLHSQQMGLFLP